MTFLSAEEDFRIRTLGSLSGVLQKLAYIAQLRSDGRYQHWGMSRTFGDEAAQAAIARNHTNAFLDALSKPLEELRAEIDLSESQDAKESLDVLRALRGQANAGVPADVGNGAASHLSFVLESLWLAERAKPASIRRAA
jgi:hypothetical protein